MVQLEALVMEGGQEEGVAWPIHLMISKSHFTSPCSLLLSPSSCTIHIHVQRRN
jgi:hypothetical protein